MKKVNVVSLIFILVVGVCFPQVEQRAEAATTPEDFGFIATIDKISGRINLLGLRPGLIVDTQVSFTSARIYGLTLSKLVRTDHGMMALTMKSSTPESRIDVSWLDVQVNSLNIGGLCWPERLLDVCLSDITIAGKGLDSNGIAIPNLVVETSFKPNEVANIQQMQMLLDEQDDAEQLEKLLLAMDEAEDGDLSKQKGEYEQLKNDLPALEEKIEQLDELVARADSYKEQIDDGATTIEEIIEQAEEMIDTPEWDDMLEQANEQQSELETTMGEFTITLEKATDLVDDIKETREDYEKLISLRSQYLEELELGDWSNSYKELEEIKERLNEINKKVDQNSDKIEQFMQEKARLTERIEAILGLLEGKAPPKEKTEETTDLLQEEFGQEEFITNEIDINELKLETEELLKQMTEFGVSFAEMYEERLNEWFTPLKQFVDDNNWKEFESKMETFKKEKKFAEQLEFFEEVSQAAADYEKKLQENIQKLIQIEKEKNEQQKDIEAIQKNIDDSQALVTSIRKQMNDLKKEMESFMDYGEKLELGLPTFKKILAVLEESDEQLTDETE